MKFVGSSDRRLAKPFNLRRGEAGHARYISGAEEAGPGGGASGGGVVCRDTYGVWWACGVGPRAP
jgi:hypothetical protein